MSKEEEAADEAYQRFIAKSGTMATNNNTTKKSGRNKKSGGGGGGVATSSTTENGKETPLARLQNMGLVNSTDHKSLKFREPSDTQHTEQKKTTRNAPKKAAVDHPIGPLNVLTRRENQNEYTLQASNKRKGEFPPLQEELAERTLASPEHRVDAFPIEEMLLRGFMPFYAYNINDILCTTSNELHREALIINNKNALLAAATSDTAQATKKRKTKHGDDAATAANGGGNDATSKEMTEEEETEQIRHSTPIVKAASQFGWNIPSYGANGTSGKAELYEKVRRYYADCMERMANFFIDDQLEPLPPNADPKTPQHRPPRSFAVYQEAEQQFRARFDERLSVFRETASRVPKLDDEPPITKEWIHSYRLRPCSGDELCSRGTSCCFNVYGKKDAMRYIGRVFETPREVHEKNKSDQPYVRNKQRLCIDCLLESWTIATQETVASGRTPVAQRNHFTVLCEPGQYNRECMLPTVMNEKQTGITGITGITGFVPAYNKNKRASVPIRIEQIEGNHFYQIKTTYLAETGTDFQ